MQCHKLHPEEHVPRKIPHSGKEDTHTGTTPSLCFAPLNIFRSLSRSGKGWECSAGSAPIIINGLGTCVLRLRRACLSANQTLSHRSRGDTVTHSLTTHEHDRLRGQRQLPRGTTSVPALPTQQAQGRHKIGQQLSPRQSPDVSALLQVRNDLSLASNHQSFTPLEDPARDIFAIFLDLM